MSALRLFIPIQKDEEQMSTVDCKVVVRDGNKKFPIPAGSVEEIQNLFIATFRAKNNESVHETNYFQRESSSIETLEALIKALNYNPKTAVFEVEACGKAFNAFTVKVSLQYLQALKARETLYLAYRKTLRPLPELHQHTIAKQTGDSTTRASKESGIDSLIASLAKSKQRKAKNPAAESPAIESPESPESA